MQKRVDFAVLVKGPFIVNDFHIPGGTPSKIKREDLLPPSRLQKCRGLGKLYLENEIVIPAGTPHRAGVQVEFLQKAPRRQ